MTRALAAVVALTASVASSFGALGLWVLGEDDRPGLFGCLIVLDAGIVGLVALLVLRSAGGGSVIAGLKRAWSQASVLAAAALGAAVSLPLFALHGAYVTDTDSQRILAATSFVAHNGPGYLRRSQDVLLPHAVFRPVVAVSGLSGARVVPILGTILLGAVVAGLAFVLTRRLFGAFVAAAAIIGMKSILHSAVELPLYEITLACGYLGGFFAFKALRAGTPKARAGWAGATAVMLALAVESHGTGQLFVIAPALVFACFGSTREWPTTVRTAVWVYGATFVALLPRLMLNLSAGGFDRITSNRNEFMVTQGYLRIVNRDFFHYPVGVGHVEYLRRIPEMVRDALGLGFGSVALVFLVGAAVIGSRWRARFFVAACFAVFALALLKAKPPPFDRYASPLLPGVALLAAVGAVQLARRQLALRFVAVAAAIVLLVAGILSFPETAKHYQRTEAALLASQAARMLPYITDDRGVIGVRASKLQGLDPNLVTWGTSFLTEDEWKTFLLWPSDAAVIAMLQSHGIGWVAVLGGRRLEVAYNNTWTEQAYGKKVIVRDKLGESANFCLRWRAGFGALFEIGPCPPPEPAPDPNSLAGAS